MSSGRRILIVDDEVAVRALLGDILISGSDLDVLDQVQARRITLLRKPIRLEQFYATLNASLSRREAVPV